VFDLCHSLHLYTGFHGNLEMQQYYSNMLQLIEVILKISYFMFYYHNNFENVEK